MRDTAMGQEQCVGRNCRVQTACAAWVQGINRVQGASPMRDAVATSVCHRAVNLICMILGPSDVEITIRFLL